MDGDQDELEEEIWEKTGGDWAGKVDEGRRESASKNQVRKEDEGEE